MGSASAAMAAIVLSVAFFGLNPWPVGAPPYRIGAAQFTSASPKPCRLGSAPAGGAPGVVMVSPPTATNNDALDILDFGAYTDTSGNLVAQIHVASLKSGPGGTPMMSGNQESYYFEFQTDQYSQWQFMGAVYGAGSLDLIIGHKADSTALFYGWNGIDDGTPGDPSDYHVIDPRRNDELTSQGLVVDRARGLLTLTAPISDFGLNPGDQISAAALTTEIDGGDSYWDNTINYLSPGAIQEHPIKLVPGQKTLTIGTHC